MSVEGVGQPSLVHNLVFIVGCPRSGTTWLQRLLACHPQIRTGHESDLFDLYIGPQLRAWRNSLSPKSSRRNVGLACYFREEEFLSILKEYMHRLLEPMVGDLQPGEFFVEKTPSHALFIPEIVELLPQSQIIHVLRDARDVVASILAASDVWGRGWAPSQARIAARMWLEHVRSVQQAASRLDTEQFHELRYEDLHACPQHSIERVCQFLGLVWDEEEINRALEKNRLEVARASGGTPISVGGEMATILGSYVKEPEGFIRRGCPGGWKQDLSLIQQIWVWHEARRTMKEFGYNWRLPW